MNKAKEISALWEQIKPQIGELARLCHEVESHYEVTADAYQRGYETAKHECEDCRKIRADAEQELADKAYQRGYENGFVDGHLKAEKSGQSFYEDGYQRGMADANRDGEYNADDGWYVMQKISLLPNPIKTELFGTAETAVILQDNSFKDALDKLTEYEQEKEDQIKVGDEVVGTYTGGEETEPFVIIRKIPEIDPTYYFGIYSKSGEFCQGGLKLKKTGRHFPEIAEVLRKMGGKNVNK